MNTLIQSSHFWFHGFGPFLLSLPCKCSYFRYSTFFSTLKSTKAFFFCLNWLSMSGSISDYRSFCCCCCWISNEFIFQEEPPPHHDVIRVRLQCECSTLWISECKTRKIPCLTPRPKQSGALTHADITSPSVESQRLNIRAFKATSSDKQHTHTHDTHT